MALLKLFCYFMHLFNRLLYKEWMKQRELFSLIKTVKKTLSPYLGLNVHICAAKKSQFANLQYIAIILLFVWSSPIPPGDEIFASPPRVCVCRRHCVCVFVCRCQHCCYEQKSCQEVKEVRPGSNRCPAKTDNSQQQDCQDASFGTAVSQHTSPEPNMGHYCGSAWAPQI